MSSFFILWIVIGFFWRIFSYFLINFFRGYNLLFIWSSNCPRFHREEPLQGGLCPSDMTCHSLSTSLPSGIAECSQLTCNFPTQAPEPATSPRPGSWGINHQDPDLRRIYGLLPERLGFSAFSTNRTRKYTHIVRRHIHTHVYFCIYTEKPAFTWGLQSPSEPTGLLLASPTFHTNRNSFFWQ